MELKGIDLHHTSLGNWCDFEWMGSITLIRSASLRHAIETELNWISLFRCSHSQPSAVLISFISNCIQLESDHWFIPIRNSSEIKLLTTIILLTFIVSTLIEIAIIAEIHRKYGQLSLNSSEIESNHWLIQRLNSN